MEKDLRAKLPIVPAATHRKRPVGLDYSANGNTASASRASERQLIEGGQDITKWTMYGEGRIDFEWKGVTTQQIPTRATLSYFFWHPHSFLSFSFFFFLYPVVFKVS